MHSYMTKQWYVCAERRRREMSDTRWQHMLLSMTPLTIDKVIYVSNRLGFDETWLKKPVKSKAVAAKAGQLQLRSIAAVAEPLQSLVPVTAVGSVNGLFSPPVDLAAGFPPVLRTSCISTSA